MGDRVTIQLIDNKDDFSPTLYLHWAGEAALEIIQKAAPIMRQCDMGYAFARLAGVCHMETHPAQALSFGIWNATQIQTEDEHGDNGHFQINIDTGEIKHFGGYEPERGADIPKIEFSI